MSKACAGRTRHERYRPHPISACHCLPNPTWRAHQNVIHDCVRVNVRNGSIRHVGEVLEDEAEILQQQQKERAAQLCKP